MKKKRKATKKKTTKAKRRSKASFQLISKRALSHLKKFQTKSKSWTQVGWFFPVFIVALLVGLFTKEKTKYPISLTSAKIEKVFSEASTLNVGDRVALWSNSLLNEPELLYPLGEGPQINDTAPLFPKGYDCTTFVEMVGALSQSKAGSDLADKLVRIRYKNGDISYQSRNHFPEADWIPNNENAGILKDITVEVARSAGFMAAFANKDIDKIAWLKSQGNEYANRAVASVKDAGPVTVKLPYLPIEKMLEALNHIPQGAVINVVRTNSLKSPVLITHQGFLIWKKGVAYFRHASKNTEIKEVPFKRYVQLMKDMEWKVVGFNINTFSG